MMVLSHLFIGFENCFVHLSYNNTLNIKFFKRLNFREFKEYDFIYISCLDGKDSFIVRKENKFFKYLKFCLKSDGEFQEKLFKVEFYKEFLGANDKLSLSKLADKLFYLNYSNFFHYYDSEKVDFYRSVIRYKLAKIYYQKNDFSKALKILSDLEKSSNFRIKFIAKNLKSEIYKRLNYKFKDYEIELKASDGIYLRGMDTLLNLNNLKVYKSSLVCELDFPEIYVIKNNKLVLWNSPIID